MLRHQSRLGARDDIADALQMFAVEAFGTAERQSHAMQRNRIVEAYGFEIAERRSAAHVILGVDFEPRRLGARFGDDFVMRKAQPDAGACRDRATLRSRGWGGGDEPRV